MNKCSEQSRDTSKKCILSEREKVKIKNRRFTLGWMGSLSLQNSGTKTKLSVLVDFGEWSTWTSLPIPYTYTDWMELYDLHCSTARRCIYYVFDTHGRIRIRVKTRTQERTGLSLNMANRPLAMQITQFHTVCIDSIDLFCEWSEASWVTESAYY